MLPLPVPVAVQWQSAMAVAVNKPFVVRQATTFIRRVSYFCRGDRDGNTNQAVSSSMRRHPTFVKSSSASLSALLNPICPLCVRNYSYVVSRFYDLLLEKNNSCSCFFHTPVAFTTSSSTRISGNKNKVTGDSPASAMDLKRVVSILDDLAPPALAESWDNVGLLVEPSPPHPVSTMCLTNDLTEEVLSEAVSKKADFILSYHPPIFVAMKRLTMQNPKERIVIRALENRIAIYSPHTCYDVIEGGVNDWLIEGLGDVEQSRPLNASSDLKTPSGDDVSVTLTAAADSAADNMLLTQHLTQANFVSSTSLNDGKSQISFTCKRPSLAEMMSSFREMSFVEHQSMQITELMKPPMLNTGAGRVTTLKDPVQLSAMVERIKTHLKLDHVQIAIGQGKTTDSLVSSVAVCAGSGASVLKNARADLFLTGEMSHHDILAAVAMGTSVVVCNHSNTERGFLHVLRKKLDEKFESSVDIFVSETDKDPLQFI